MPLPGGPSDKAGNQYELMWTVLRMIDAMRDQADSISIEPFPPDGAGAEFILIRKGRREHHQVKRQQSGKGHWTIRDVAGVLGHARRKLIDPQANFVFVSMEAAAELRELCEAAATVSSFAAFKAAFLTAGTRLGPFRNLREVWRCDDEGAFALLPRITVKTIEESLLRDMVDALLSPLVGGVPTSLRDVLALFALDSVHRTLTAHDLWRHLENRGHRPLDWARDATVTAAVSALNERYLAHQLDIGGITIPRAEAKAIVEAFSTEIAHRTADNRSDGVSAKLRGGNPACPPEQRRNVGHHRFPSSHRRRRGDPGDASRRRLHPLCRLSRCRSDAPRPGADVGFGRRRCGPGRRAASLSGGAGACRRPAPG